MAAKPRGKFMDVLGVDDSPEASSSEAGSDSEHDPAGGPASRGCHLAPQAQDPDGPHNEEQPGEAAAGPAKRSKAVAVTVEELMAAGYKAPSVLRMRAHQEPVQQDWSWSDGKAAKAQQPEAESYEERRATAAAASTGADETARFAQAALLHAERIREERRLEKEGLAAGKKLSVSHKEKRKRDEGKQSRGKSYVEEEKRLQRSFGVYSGFDT